MNVLPDFQILHRRREPYLFLECRCAEDNLIDRVIAAWSCLSCLQPFGFSIPIVRDEGRLTQHLSCAIESDIAESDRNIADRLAEVGIV